MVGLLSVAWGCAPRDGHRVSSPDADLEPPRGVILISIDTLRADRLGAYGYAKETSPNFDRLAASGVLFEHAIAPYPSTLTSHMSMFTGYYPQEHGVLPPSTVLADSIETLPERFLEHGFRTAGHTEGGFVAGGYGFRRGFEEFTDTAYQADTDVERTFDRGLAFLRRLGADDRFFLFLHTYSVHDPYTPPEEYQRLFWSQPPPDVFASSGENLRRINEGELDLSAEGLTYFEAMYDASVRYVDDVLGRFVAELTESGLLAETLLVVTSDHGEEFLEHGRMAHTQVYPECLEVPLLIVHPDLATGRSVRGLVELVDLPPTLYELAGLPAPATLSGESLVAQIGDPERMPIDNEAYAEVLDIEFSYTLWSQKSDHLFQIMMTEPEVDPTGPWVRGAVSFDVEQPVVRFEAHSFHEPRVVRVLIDDREQEALQIEPHWAPVEIVMPRGEGMRRLRLEADGCLSPSTVSDSEDDRCLAFQMRGLRPLRFELYDLVADPGAQNDIYPQSGRIGKALSRRLLGLEWQALAAGSERTLSAEDEATLKALGYLD